MPNRDREGAAEAEAKLTQETVLRRHELRDAIAHEQSSRQPLLWAAA
jgi:hypothetical protein